MNYIELDLKVDPEFSEILMAELGEAGFESFVETDEGLLAYIQEEEFREEAITEITTKYLDLTTIAATWKSLERRNWNEEWEKSYEPIEVGDQVRVRATFHEPDPSFKYDLLIQPKMSFGTGHHETTWLVMNEQLSLPHERLSIMDVGCGTGILAILAHRRMGRREYPRKFCNERTSCRLGGISGNDPGGAGRKSFRRNSGEYQPEYPAGGDPEICETPRTRRLARYQRLLRDRPGRY